MGPRKDRRDTLHKLFIRHTAALRAYLLALIPNEDAVDDVLHATFLAIDAKADAFDPSGDFAAWARGIARYELLRYLRDRGRVPRCLSPEVIEKLSVTVPVFDMDEDRTARGNAYRFRPNTCILVGSREIVMKRMVVLVVLCVVGLSCSSSTPAEQDLNAWTREVEVITPSEVGDRLYDEIAGFEEKARIGIGGEEDAIASAKSRLRRRAAKVDADAIVIIRCGRNVASIEEDPMPSNAPMVVCQGVAIRWLD